MIYQLTSKKGFRKKNLKAAIFYAHPDDETIFMGGTILTHPHWIWDLYCFTYTSDSVRGNELKRAVELLKLFGVKRINLHMLGFEDTKESSILERDFDLYKLKIQEIEKQKKFDLVFTHNSKGDYGHPQHIKINNAVKEEIKRTAIWEFICLAAEKVVPVPFIDDVLLVQIGSDILSKKLKVFESYPSQMSTWKDLFPIMNYEFKIGVEVFTKSEE